MSRKTCRNGFVFVAVICLGLMVTSARGGSLDSPAAPTNPASAMFTLDDIYNKLDTRAAVSKRTGVFTEPSGGPTNGTMHTLNDIMTLVTNRAPVPKTGQTNTWAVGDDGWYSTNVGVAWPNPRFTAVAESGAETNQIRDNLTGLIWARNANLASNTTWSVAGTCTWEQAFDVITNSAGPVNGANYGGTNDWRLPNMRELESLVDYGGYNPALCNTAGTGQWVENDPFTGVQSLIYWSSTSSAQNPGFKWVMMLDVGRTCHTAWSGAPYTYYVWPVRGGRQ